METGSMMVILGYFGYVLKELPSKLFKILLMCISFSFSTTSKDREIYNEFNRWLLSLDKRIINDNLNAKSQYDREISGMKTQMSINYGKYFFFHNKNLCFVSKELVENNWDISDKVTIRVVGFRRDKIKNVIIDISKKAFSDEKMMKIYPMPNCYDNYKVVKKSFDDIFVYEKDKIIKHLDNWKSSEEFYDKHGIVYKTGILMHGGAGTGKTSCAKAIASYMNMNIHIINLNSYKEEKDLIDKIIHIQPNSVVLFEDIDCVLKGRQENDKSNENDNLLGTILNILDGVMSPRNCIFVATTNHINKLDNALIRKGRFDLSINMDNINESLAKDMCDRFEVGYDILKDEKFPINPSYLQSKILDKIK